MQRKCTRTTLNRALLGVVYRLGIVVIAVMVLCMPVFSAESLPTELTAPCGNVRVPDVPNVICMTYCGPNGGTVRCADVSQEMQQVDAVFALAEKSDVQILIRGTVNVGQLCRALSAITGWQTTCEVGEIMCLKPVLWNGTWTDFVKGPVLETVVRDTTVTLSINKDKKIIRVIWSD